MDELSSMDRAPPEITGDITIARFLDSDGAEKWRVSLLGHTHFLTDHATAQRIRALAAPDVGRLTYPDAYAAYRSGFVEPVEPLADFVRWCEMHRDRLERLATTPDQHPLRFRRLLFAAKTCDRVGELLRLLFMPWCIVALWCASLLIVALYLFHRESSDGAHFWPALALTLLGVLVHELGHITACVRHGARQGGIGIGLYWIWPAFYADVRGSWVLPSRQRALVSVGGLYFQSVYLAAMATIAVATHSATLALAIGMSLLLMVTTLNPVFKFDGYWILSDLLNVTNLHTRIAAHLRALSSARGGERIAFLRTGTTALSIGFALVAVAYVAYVFYFMTAAGIHTAMRMAALWSALANAVEAPTFMLGSLASIGGSLASCLLQLAFVGMGTVFLGLRSVNCVMDLLPSRRGSDEKMV
jgi:putative peptide zinc metalloprotease protein